MNGDTLVQVNADIFLDGVTNIAQEGEMYTDILYSWKRYDRNNQELKYNAFKPMFTNKVVTKNGKKYFKTAIYFSSKDIVETNKITCSASYNNKIIGTKSLTLKTSDTSNYNLIIEGDNIVYKYDTYGNSPLEETYNGPATAKINDANPIKSITYKMYNKNGEEVTVADYKRMRFKWYVPINSLIESKDTFDKDENNETIVEQDRYYTISGIGLEAPSQFNYGIATRFDRNKSDNTIILEIAYNGEVFIRKINILFTKDGDSGTNGTVYSGKITLGEENSEERFGYGECDLQGYEYRYRVVNIKNGIDNAKYFCDYKGNIIDYLNAPKFYPVLYKNGKPLEYNTDFTVAYNLYDERYSPNSKFSLSEIGSLGEVSLEIIDDADLDMTNNYILMATFTINLETLDDTKKQIFAFYPIELVSMEDYDRVLPRIRGGFNEVVYESDGSNPSYDGSTPFKIEFTDALNGRVFDEEFLGKLISLSSSSSSLSLKYGSFSLSLSF